MHQQHPEEDQRGEGRRHQARAPPHQDRPVDDREVHQEGEDRLRAPRDVDQAPRQEDVPQDLRVGQRAHILDAAHEDRVDDGRQVGDDDQREEGDVGGV